MPLPVTATMAADAWASLRRWGGDLKVRGGQLRVQLDAGTVYPAFLLDVLSLACAALGELPALGETPGLRVFYQAQLADPVLDLTTPFAEALGALAALQDAIVAEYPCDPETGMMLDRTLGADGAVAWSTLPAASLPQVSAALDAFLAALD